MKHLLTAIACCLAMGASAQVVDTTYYGNEVQINLNMSELSSTITQLQSDVSQLNGGQATSNQSSSSGAIIQYAFCRTINSSSNGQVSFLINCVNDSIAAGWSPFGAAQFSGAHAAQVIVKYAD